MEGKLYHNLADEVKIIRSQRTQYAFPTIIPATGIRPQVSQLASKSSTNFIIQKSVVLNTWDSWKILKEKYTCNCKKPWRQRRRNSFSSTLPLTSAIDGGGKLTSIPGRFILGEWHGTHIIGGWWARRPVWTGAGSLVPILIRSPHHPARSESLQSRAA